MLFFTDFCLTARYRKGLTRSQPWRHENVTVTGLSPDYSWRGVNLAASVD